MVQIWSRTPPILWGTKTFGVVPFSLGRGNIVATTLHYVRWALVRLLDKRTPVIVRVQPWFGGQGFGMRGKDDEEWTIRNEGEGR